MIDEYERTKHEVYDDLKVIEQTLLSMSRWLEIIEPKDEAPLNLEQAICLPILGGELRRDGNHTPSLSMTVSLLRKAIAKGSLRRYRDGKNIYVSKRHIQEWLQTCQENENPHASISNQPVSAAKVVRQQRGTSGTLTRQQESRSNSARDVAMTRLAALKLKLS